MSSYEMDVKVKLSISLHADSYNDAVKQIEYWLLKQDMISDFNIINIDACCNEEDDD